MLYAIINRLFFPFFCQGNDESGKQYNPTRIYQ